jgi:TonB family protein
MYGKSRFGAAALIASFSAFASPLSAKEADDRATPPTHVLSASSAASGTQGVPVDHTSTDYVAFDEWINRVQNLLVRNLQHSQGISPYSSGTGVVRIKFNCSDSGKPDKVTLKKSSGDLMLDRAALRAMSRVATLHPLPTGFNHGQRFEAEVVFASDEYDARLKAMAAEQTRHNAWYHDPVRQAKAEEASGKAVVALADSN